LANVLLDDVDKELERRGHAFVRYADDLNVYGVLVGLQIHLSHGLAAPRR
jgi:hypothetical protein